ncbi:arginine--tRNA ligase [Spirochaetota bacterium]
MKESPKKRIHSIVTNALDVNVKKGAFPGDICQRPVKIEYPSHKKFGDYSTPISMELAKIVKKPPAEVAAMITKEIKENGFIKKVEIAHPGFINFYINTEAFNGYIAYIVQSKEYGKTEKGSPENIILEYVSANPTGPLHIGHGRWAAIGDVLGNILAYTGDTVTREFYVNNAGNQIKLLGESIKAAKEGKEIPEGGYHGDYITEIAEGIGDDDPVEYILSQQKKVLDTFRSRFDSYFLETSLYDEKKIQELITFLEEKGYTYTKDGAVWFRSTTHGDDKDRVLIKKDGSYTYFAVDIAYHYMKVERRFTRMVNVFGADHHGYVQRLRTACDVISGGGVGVDIIIGQLVNLFRGGEPVRMSKRTGDIITLEEVIDEIGVDAARYYLSSLSADTPLDFDLEAAQKQSSDNPVYYIQYAHARIQSLYRNADEKGISPVDEHIFDYTLIRSESTDDIVKHLIRFPDDLADMAATYEIYHLHGYLYSLATMFHKFYFDYKILDTEHADVSGCYLYFIKAVERVLRIGLGLLGINAPDQM